MKILFSALLAASATVCAGQASTTPPPAAPVQADAMPVAEHLAKGSAVYIEPMAGFETYLAAAILKKKVPVVIVDDRAKAAYVIAGNSKVEAVGWARAIFISPLPHAMASITVKNIHTGALAYAYAVDKSNARKADQSIAEACAKHLKEAIEK